VRVWVLTVDQDRRRVSLTLIPPGTERKLPDKKAPQPRPQQEGKRPPRGRRQGPRHGQVARPNRTPAKAPITAPAPDGNAVPGGNAVASPPAARESPPPAAQRSAPPPRRPQKNPPKAKLSKAALAGDSPLRTFGELKAFFEAKDKNVQPVPGEGNQDSSVDTKDQGTAKP